MRIQSGDSCKMLPELRDWGQEEKGTTEDEMAGWHHRLNGHEFEWTPGVGDGQGGLACCGSWGLKELDTTERLNWTELIETDVDKMEKNLPAIQKEPGFDPWVDKIPWRRERLPTPVFWSGKSHGLYNPWGLKELDMTFTFIDRDGEKAEQNPCWFNCLLKIEDFLLIMYVVLIKWTTKMGTKTHFLSGSQSTGHLYNLLLLLLSRFSSVRLCATP